MLEREHFWRNGVDNQALEKMQGFARNSGFSEAKVYSKVRKGGSSGCSREEKARDDGGVKEEKSVFIFRTFHSPL